MGLDVALRKFDDLFDDDGAKQYTAEERYKLLLYVMNRYANMRGTYFVKYLAGTR